MPGSVKIRLLHAAIGEFAFPLDERRPLVIGRSGDDVDIELNWDERVSRRHLRVWLSQGSVWVEDLGSKNGTWRGANRLSVAERLMPGNSVIVGETALLAPDFAGHEVVTDERTITGVLPFPGLDRESAYSGTLDLRNHTADLANKKKNVISNPPRVETVVPPIRVLRAAESEIVIEVDEKERRGIFTKELSKGGIFVPADYPYAPLAEVTLTILGIERGLRANVVHVVSPADARTSGRSPGIGLALHGFGQGLRAELETWAKAKEPSSPGLLPLPNLGAVPIPRGIGPATAPPIIVNLPFHTPRVEAASPARPTPPAPPGPPIPSLPVPESPLFATPVFAAAPAMPAAPLASTKPEAPADPAVEAAFERAKTFIDLVERGDVYAALAVRPESTEDVLKKSIEGLRRAFGDAIQSASKTRSARLEAALERLLKIAQAMLDGRRRVEYDFRHGHVRAEERIQAAKAGTGVDIATLRRIWHLAHPERVDRAAFLTRRAFTARQKGDLAEALSAARAALEHNPFFDELRGSVKAWEEQLSGQPAHKSPARPKSPAPGHR
ncbi:MAG: FHA domain-containing protein [Myxococcota bacterium]